MKNNINPEQIIKDTIKRIVDRKKIDGLGKLSIKELREAREFFEEVGMSCMRWEDAIHEAIHVAIDRSQKKAKKEVDELVASKN